LDSEFLSPASRRNSKRGERYAEREVKSYSDSPVRHSHGRHLRHVLNSPHPKSIISLTLSDESGRAPE
jgi:hypothetical protein